MRRLLPALVFLAGCRDRDAPRPLPVSEVRDASATPCPGVLCGGRCVETDHDVAHCGGCGKACPEGTGCAAGLCTSASGWATNAARLRGLACTPGERFAIRCPSTPEVGNVWGTDLYTDDSSICTAAVHAGLLGLATGGDVAIELRPGATSYLGSKRNGIDSHVWAAWGCSFVFLSRTCAAGSRRCAEACTDVARDPRHCGACGKACGVDESCRAGACVNGSDALWTTSVSDKPCSPGTTHTFHCPKGAVPVPQPTVWGSSVFTADSSVCAAAVHDGKPTETIVIEMRPGQPAYTGTKSHGVTSTSYGPWTCSFVVR
ncbi:MAG: hypothetical protein IPJ34_34890 [Myxococcales bacterium]|nr:hypothetical protein [Myxococcales bacterium]